MVFRPLAISNSHVINARRSGPLHLRQMRGTASLSRWTRKIKALVEAGRFERPTPCAQGSFLLCKQPNCFQLLTFQLLGAHLLKVVGICGFWSLRTPTRACCRAPLASKLPK